MQMCSVHQPSQGILGLSGTSRRMIKLHGWRSFWPVFRSRVGLQADLMQQLRLHHSTQQVGFCDRQKSCRRKCLGSQKACMLHEPAKALYKLLLLLLHVRRP